MVDVLVYGPVKELLQQVISKASAAISLSYPEQHVPLALLVGQVDIVEGLLPVLVRTKPELQDLLGGVGGELLLRYDVGTLAVNIVEGLNSKKSK